MSVIREVHGHEISIREAIPRWRRACCYPMAVRGRGDTDEAVKLAGLVKEAQVTIG
jgi:hypothetical protein